MLRVRGLRKTYGDFVAVDDLDLEAHKGEILALLGPNGAGKSSTIQCLVGLLSPDGGTIEIGGHDALGTPAAARALTGYVPETARIYDALTPTEYLQLKGRLFGMDEDAIALGIDRLLEGFGLGARRHQPVAGFSKGMQQKVAISAALLPSPELLVLDEPLSGLDVETTGVVKEIVREFASRGGTVLYSSHVLDVVETLADRVAVLDRGQLRAVGTMDELRAQASGGPAAEGTRLEDLFRTLTAAEDPRRRARAILGDTADETA
jgi:ABC-2 type transport system ATP-binding protein